jgi:3-phenylpropionate/trans-cinnamate dioxygenase ferredoxin reductase component
MPAAGIVVVGGSLAGLNTTESLRSRGWTGPITVVDGHRAPHHDRPPMSKGYLSGQLSAERLLLRNRERLDGLDVAWELGNPATGLDVAARVLGLDDGRELRYDQLVVATGVTPVLPRAMDVPAAHTLRNLDDADRLRAHAHRGARLIVVGAGFIGLEVAATFRGAGAAVEVVEALPTPLYRQVGPVVGQVVLALHERNGVRFHLGRRASTVQQQGTTVTVTLDDGTALCGDALLVAVGSAPATGWLAGSGLQVDGGLVVDARLAAAPGVHAVGDVTRWPHPLAGRLIRVEHWTNAIEQGKYVAGRIAGGGGAEPFAALPYFWSDQYDRRIQAHGFVDPGGELEVIDGDPDAGTFAALCRSGGRATAVIGMNSPRQVLAGRRKVIADLWADLSKQEVPS